MVYLAPLDRVRNCFPVSTPPLLVVWRVSPMDLIRVPGSELRLEKAERPAEEVSVSLGAVKEPVLFLGIARMSSRDSFLPSAGALNVDATWSEFWEPRSVSAPSLSEVSPRRARRSMEARVGRGADRLLDRVRTCWVAALGVFPPSSF